MPDKIIKKSYIVWAAVCLLYLLFIAFFSCLYPFGIDEYKYMASRLSEVFYVYFDAAMTHNPRIGFLFAIFFPYIGKWFFVLVNPFIQISVVFGVFYFVYMRMPDFKMLKDFYVFGIIMLLSALGVPSPDNMLFWIGGVCNYVLIMLAILAVLIMMRVCDESKIIIKNNFIAGVLMFATGFIAGAGSENGGPMTFGLLSCFWVWTKFVRRKPVPPWLYAVAAGVVLGLVFLFNAPGSYKRLSDTFFLDFRNSSLPLKLFMHLGGMHNMYEAMFFLPVFGVLAAAFALRDKFKTAVTSKDFILGALCFGVSFVLAFVLFAAPYVSSRAFYSAAVFNLMSLIFIIKYLDETYKINIAKFLYLAMLILFIVILPLFTIPYLNLRKSFDARMAEMRNFKGEVYPVTQIRVIANPIKNYNITYYDVIHILPKFREIEGIRPQLIKPHQSEIGAAAQVI